MFASELTTGLPGLDRVLHGLMPGDSLVWQVESLADFTPFAIPCCQAALAQGRNLIYFRFAEHAPLLPESLGAAVHELARDMDFEPFVAEMHQVIQRAGPGAVFVFDCLSNLVDNWNSDRMLGNFFMLACPSVHDSRSLAYFPLIRYRHSFHASTPIVDTTQIMIDVYRHEGHLYLHPTKVAHRFSSTMNMLHKWDGDRFQPVMESATTAKILSSRPWYGLESVRLRPGKWTRTFFQAEEIWEGIRRGELPAKAGVRILPELLGMTVSRDPRVVRLVERYLTLTDVLDIFKRMIGSGLIGGKALGMLLARAILKSSDPRWNERLEDHDSFFIGSNVFCSYLVENGCWWPRQKQRDPDCFLDNIEETQRRIQAGHFADYLVKEFAEVLEYFGQSPIIVRSSSLLEDNYGNAFAGKYESVFCPNQGPQQKRLEDFLSAVKTIYASAMSEKALHYRAQRGLLDQDEQMSLLVQRVSGARYGNLFYPQIAGVALSRNPYVWNECIDPNAGVVRLVFGLGTRAVDRSDDDYTRIVALNAPERRPEGDLDRVRQYSQRKVDVIDLEANHFTSYGFDEVAARSERLPLHVFASQNGLSRQNDWSDAPSRPRLVLTFDELLSQTPFVDDMREMLQVLQKAYDYPVDLEFTANFFADDPGKYKLNLVQCRPLQVASDSAAVTLPKVIDQADCVLEARGAVIGRSRANLIDRVVYVAPSLYGQLPLRDCYAVARSIGRLLHLDQPRSRRVMLIGPGRWGTTTPSLGVPVCFAEIDTVSILCEIVAMREDLVPDVSLGTHFFNDLVEMDMLYLALFPRREGNSWNRAFFEQTPNRLPELLPDEAHWSDVVHVIDMPLASLGGARLKLSANSLTQQVICYLDRRTAKS